MDGSKLVAMEGERLVGVIHWVSSPACQYSGEKVRMIPVLLRGIGLRSTLNLMSFN